MGQATSKQWVRHIEGTLGRAVALECVRHSIRDNLDLQHEDLQYEDLQYEDLQHEDLQHEDLQHEDLQHEFHS